MDYKTLSASIFEQEALGTLAVISNTGVDILTDDFNEDRYIPYHLVPPTREWLKSRVVWGKSIPGDLDALAGYIADTLFHIDPNMFICLNRICIISSEDDIEPLCDEIGADSDEFPNCIDFETQDILGCKWHTQNSVIINAAAIVKAAHELADEDPDGYYSAEDEIEIGFWTTLLHGIRHLGLECNPFLPEDEYPLSLQSEANVEAWAVEQYEIS